MNLPASSGQPLLSAGQHRIAKFMAAAIYLGRVASETGNQDEAEVMVEAQKAFDETLGALTGYVLAHEKIAEAYMAAIPGGARCLEFMLDHSDTVVIAPRKNYTELEVPHGR